MVMLTNVIKLTFNIKHINFIVLQFKQLFNDAKPHHL